MAKLNSKKWKNYLFTKKKSLVGSTPGLKKQPNIVIWPNVYTDFKLTVFRYAFGITGLIERPYLKLSRLAF